MSDSTSASAAVAPSAAEREHILHMKKLFQRVYGVLIAGTVLTVGMYYVYFEEMWQTVTVAMLIATAKGSFVAAVFMHLWHDHRSLRAILLYTGVVAVGLFALTIYSFFSVPAPHYFLR